MTNNRRCQPPSSQCVDARLLSSPLLHSLDYSVFYFWKGNGVVSDFPYLMKILANSPRLRKLRIGIYAKEQTLNPELTQFSTLPDQVQSCEQALKALRSLKLSERTLGNVTPDYCEELQIVSSVIWAGCNDIPQTTELELHGLSPRYVFENIEGKTPNLKGLDFPLRSLIDYGGNPLPKSTGDINKVCEVIGSLPGLEELQLSNYDMTFHSIWPAITAHMATLKLLRIRSTNLRYHGLNQHEPLCYLLAPQIQALQQSNVTHLEMDVSLRAAFQTWHPHSLTTSEEPADHLVRLSELRNLRALRLCVAVAESSPRFALLAKRMAPNIYRAFYAHSPAARLKHLSICFVNGLSTNVISELRWERNHTLDSSGRCVATLTLKRLIRPSALSSLARYEKRSEGKKVVSELVNPDGVWSMLASKESNEGVLGDETIVLDLAKLALGN